RPPRRAHRWSGHGRQRRPLGAPSGPPSRPGDGGCPRQSRLRRAPACRVAPAVEQRAIRWLGAATVVSAVLFVGTPIGARCLLVPLVGGAALIAVVIARWWTVWRLESVRRRRVLGVACAGLAVIHLGFAPIGRLAGPVLLRHVMTTRAAAAIPDAELDPATLANQTVVVLVAPDLVVGMHAAFHQLLYRLPMPARWRVLSWAPARHRFVRTGSDTLQMQ